MDRFDEVFSVLTEDQGWSEENAKKIMVYCAEQGMNPLEAGARFIGGMAGLPTVDLRKSFFNPWNMFPKKAEPQKGLPKTGPSSPLPTQKALPPARPIPTPNQTQGMLGSRSVPNIQQVSSKYGLDTPAPKPEFGPGSTKPVGPNPARSIFDLPRPDAGIKARNALSAPKPKVKPSLNPRTFIKNAIKGALVSAAGYGLNKLMGAGGDKSSAPTADQKAQKLAQQKAETTAPSAPEPTGERSASASAAKQETAKANAQRRRDSAASFDKAFAAARGADKSTFTWRGKSYNTKLK